ncbi:unnamed protein product [Boreogadus saida]
MPGEGPLFRQLPAGDTGDGGRHSSLGVSDSQKHNSSQSLTCSSEGDSRISSASTSSDTSANISATSSATESDSFQLTADSATEFSVWVSFCGIYRENIHDLLETQEPRTQKRNILRLAQDVKGNSFIKAFELDVKIRSLCEPVPVYHCGTPRYMEPHILGWRPLMLRLIYFLFLRPSLMTSMW